jgi:mRNA interferase RelE/StbE
MSEKYTFKFSKKFNNTLSKLDKKIQEQIMLAIINFLAHAKNSDVKKLKGHKELYRIRSGNYRIIFSQQDDVLIIIFLDVKHRKEAYRDL